MRRVVSVWLPTLPTDRLRRTGSIPSDGSPLVTSQHDGRRLVVAAADAAAAGLELHTGMPLAQAQALVPGLAIRPAEPDAEAAMLRELAGWCLRYAPLTAPAPPDGIWLDVTGCAHLFGGETRLLRDLTGRLAGQGIAARAAVADTPGMAHALARYGARADAAPPLSWPGLARPSTSLQRLPRQDAGGRGKPGHDRGGSHGGGGAAIISLPIAALRLPPDILDSLRLLGLERIGQVQALPRAPLTRRFGPLVALRLDQLSGSVFEPIEPVFPPGLVQARLSFVEPLLTAEAFVMVIARLTGSVCTALERAGQGARRLDLLFERVDGAIPSIRIGTARASRDPRHLARLLEERLERIDPGLGVEAMRLVVPQADPLAYAQGSLAAEAAGLDLSVLVDRLGNRLGAARVYRAVPVESDVPERSVRRVSALAVPHRANWPEALPRPVRLLDPPQPVDAMALLPDQPPVVFTWRRVRHRVRHADGPERIAGEWWKSDAEMQATRDYFRVEDEQGRRFWLFRRGDGEDAATGDLRWFLHGLF